MTLLKAQLSIMMKSSDFFNQAQDFIPVIGYSLDFFNVITKGLKLKPSEQVLLALAIVKFYVSTQILHSNLNS
jgi:hypothetical protein